MITRTSTSLFALIVFIGSAARPMYAVDDVSLRLTPAVAADCDVVSIRQAMAQQTATLAVAQRFAHTHRPRCESKKKGTLIGAAVGAIAGAAFAVYVNDEAGGVLGTANGAKRFLAYWTSGGAAGGALVGYTFCR